MAARKRVSRTIPHSISSQPGNLDRSGERYRIEMKLDPVLQDYKPSRMRMTS
jgi:hypothetical protein